MEMRFAPRGVVEFDNARIIFRNFAGRRDTYNKNGDRNFCLVIPNQEIADELMADTNRYGAGWNVKVKVNEDATYIHLPVKVNFDGKPPVIYLVTNGKKTRLDEDTVACLDDIDIAYVDLDISPYDGEGMYGPFRSAYLRSMCVYQEVDRFAARFAAEECPED